VSARPLRRVGVLGDVHGEAQRVRTALALFAEQGVDRVLAVGDYVDGPENPNPAIELLDDRDVLCVAGNHERWILGDTVRDLPHAQRLHQLSDQAAAFLRKLPAQVELDTVSGRLLLCHGLGPHDMAMVRPGDLASDLDGNEPLQELVRAGRHRYVVNGHSHLRMVRRVGSFTIVNAGTLLASDDPCCALVDFEAERAEFWSLDDPRRPERAERAPLEAWAELF
jgi:predicted phosphodiesterase